MADPPPPLDDDDAIFRRLAQMDLAWAEKVHAQAMAATETDEINSLGRTYQRAARSLRQTLALKAKLKADAVRQAREARAERAQAERLEKRARLKREFDRLIGRPVERGDWREAPDWEDDLEDEDPYPMPENPTEADVRTWLERHGEDPADPEVIRRLELCELPVPKPLREASEPTDSPAVDAPSPARPPDGDDSS